MAMKLVCAETGAKCPFEVVAPTKEELMEHIGIHAKMAHPEMAANPPSPEMMEKLIHQV
jgi:predicted small metal-binding protein